jgi:putative spermidine/putrescine transport system permease protein
VAIFVLNIFSKSGLIARFLASLNIISSSDQFVSLVYDKYGVGIMLAYLWKEIPFIIYFVLALMSNINESLGEASINLGANSLQTFRRVTLPLCKNTILSGFLIIFTFSLGAYEIPQLLGPTLPKTLPILAHIQYVHPNLQNRPYAMALNGIIIIISLIAATIYYNLIKNNIPKGR